ncbi:MAG: hypothetical protein HC923_12255 [Myxococcales bacterium]|nr:hypothetical protein [Myxococcales bacterium]
MKLPAPIGTVQPSYANRAERFRASFKLVYDDGESFSAGAVRDVSETGLFLETAHPAPLGSVLTLFPVDEASQDLFEIHAEVVRVHPEDPDSSTLGGMGLRFLDIDDMSPQIRGMIQTLAARERNRVKDPFLGVRVNLPRPQQP